MTTNSQLSTTELKKTKTKTKQTTRTGTESQKWRSHGGLSAGRGTGKNGGKVQGRRSINGRYKIHRGRLRIVSEMEKTKNLCVSPMDMNQGVGGMWVGDGLQGRGGKGGQL